MKNRLRKFGETGKPRKRVNENLSGIVPTINQTPNAYPPSFLIFLRQMVLIEDAPATTELVEMFCGYVNEHLGVALDMQMDDNKVYELVEALRYGDVTLLHENTESFPYNGIRQINQEMIMVSQCYDYRKDLSIAMIMVSRKSWDDDMILTDEI